MEKDKEETPVKRDAAYWHSKHPVVSQLYDGRPLPDGNSYTLDIRHFIWPDDHVLSLVLDDRKLAKDYPDETALAVQKYVVNLVDYTSDKTLGRSDYWLFPVETLLMKKGDCEDGAILIASLLLNALSHENHWRVRVAAGTVQASPTAPQGGHGYCCYCRSTDNEWVALDWCYFEDSKKPVHKKTLIKDTSFYKNVWFSFNHRYSWSHVSFDMKGRLHDGEIPDGKS